jgi:hypothetical protein
LGKLALSPGTGPTTFWGFILKAIQKKSAFAALSVAAGFAMAGAAHAGAYSSYGTLIPTNYSNLGTNVPNIVAGDPNGSPPDSPAARVDPNVPTSPFSGVVSINIRYSGQSYICSGTLVSKRDVISAGHCVDTTGNGTVIDVSKSFAQSGNDVRVVFNANSGPTTLRTADAVYMNPFYQGFGNCPAAAPPNSFCLNDDISVIHLNQDAPANAKIYGVLAAQLSTGQLDTMVGYGVSGDGVGGYSVNPSFFVKRTGQNIMDLFDTNDEQGFSDSSPREVWYADFDGNGQDTFCDYFGVCTAQLANNVETMLGGGDSGGPSFYHAGNGDYYLMGNNTFSGNLFQSPNGQFGDYSGGILLSSYIPWLESVTNNQITVVPEPSTTVLSLLGLGLLGFAARRRNNG